MVSKIRKIDYYDLVDQKRTIQSVYNKASKNEMFCILKTYGEKDQIDLVPEYQTLLEQLPTQEVYADKEVADDIGISTLTAARETGNTTLDIRLFPGTDRHFVPQHIMTSLLKSFSSLVDSIFGKRHSNSLRVCTAPGSCIVRFSFDDQIDLFDESSAIHEVKIINSILQSDSIENNLEKVKNKSGFVQSYSNMLKAIQKTKNPVQFTSAYPNSTDTNMIELSTDLISKRTDQMNSMYDKRITKQTLIGRLIALDIKSKKFKFQMTEQYSDTIILGSIDDDILSESYEVPGLYSAVIQQTEYIDHNDYIPRKNYHLEALTVLN